MSKNNTVENPFASRCKDNETVPIYIAYASEDSYVDADDNLDRLLTVLVKHCRLHREDVVVWRCTETIVAVVKANGVVTRL